ncbi:hypothetical protein D3C86_2018580 [compost metagenome]
MGAALPKVTTLTCRAGTAAKAAVAQRNRVISVGMTATLVQLSTVEITAMLTNTPISVALRRLSASLPPRILPTVSPRPISSRVQVTPRGEMPVTSPSNGAT